MQPVYGMQWHITTEQTDCFDRLRPASLLGIVQEVAGEHSIALGAGRDELLKKSLLIGKQTLTLICSLERTTVSFRIEYCSVPGMVPVCFVPQGHTCPHSTDEETEVGGENGLTYPRSPSWSTASPCPHCSQPPSLQRRPCPLPAGGLCSGGWGPPGSSGAR